MTNNENTQADIEKIKGLWGKQAQVEDLENRKFVSWMNYPFIEKDYLNKRYSDNSDQNWLDYVHRKYIPHTLDLGLTVGCGDGGLERHSVKVGICKKFEAFDIADGAIEVARNFATQENLDDKIKYGVTNINQLQLERNKYDIVFACMSAHHFSELEHVFSEIKNALKPGGYFVLNEFVGPTQFQWTDQQLSIINDLLSILPRKYREYISSPGHYKDNTYRMTIEEINNIDPSEAIRSAEIVPLLSRYFNVIEKDDYGGTILHILLHDIVGNFDLNQEGDIAILKIICYFEQLLIKSNVISSDFSLIIAENTLTPTKAKKFFSPSGLSDIFNKLSSHFK